MSTRTSIIELRAKRDDSTKMTLTSINVFIIHKKISRFMSSKIRSTSMKSKAKIAKTKKSKVEKAKTEESNTTKKSETTTKSFSKVKSATNFSKFEKIFFERERINRESTYKDFLSLSIFCLNFRSRLIISVDLRKKAKDFASRVNWKFVMMIDTKK